MSVQNKMVETLREVPTAEQFFPFVAKRSPVVLRGCAKRILSCRSGGGNEQQELSLEGIKQLLLDSPEGDHNSNHVVEVNQRCQDSFSPEYSNVIQMSLTSLIEKIQKDGCTDYYMTTQPLPIEDEDSGRPALVAFPVDALIDQGMIPLRPKLLGHLIPMTMNLWLGRSSTDDASNTNHKSSSSGLHHDFHDNLYLLAQGKKTFRIAPPQSVHRFNMKGTLRKLHENGRIVYQEQVHTDMIRADGAVESVERLLNLQKRKEALESDLQALREGNTDERAKLEQQMDDVEEEMLEFELPDDGDDEEEDDDDDDSSCQLFGGASRGADDGEDGEPSCQLLGETSRRKASPVSDGRSSNETTNTPNRRASPKINNVDTEHDDPSSDTIKRQKTNQLPLNFVIGDPPPDILFEEVNLEAGDALYLPAGWFHEVQSSGGIHLALNYWMHPPDTVGQFERPYISDFWVRDWQDRGFA